MLAAVKDAARRLRRWPAAILDRGLRATPRCIRPGRENAAPAEQENADRALPAAGQLTRYITADIFTRYRHSSDAEASKNPLHSPRRSRKARISLKKPEHNIASSAAC